MSTIKVTNLRHESATSDNISLTSTNRVGIGTSSPQASLHVDGANTAARGQFVLEGASADARMTFYRDADFIGHIAGNSDHLDIATETGHHIEFSPAGSERVRIDTDGLKFNGDTATTNALDDYEEGTWTPSYTTGFTGTYATNGQIGRYIKVGNLVTAYFFLQVNSISGSGALALGGLPFATVSATNYNPGAVIQLTGNWNTTHPFCVDASGSGTSTYNVKYRSSSSGNTDTNSTVAHLATNAYMRATIVYETA